MCRSVLASGGTRHQPRARWLILVLLALIVASPFSSGDKGLWLSIAPAPIQVFEASSGHFAAEESTLLQVRGDPAPCPVSAAQTGPDWGIALHGANASIARNGCRARAYLVPVPLAPPDTSSGPFAPRGPPA